MIAAVFLLTLIRLVSVVAPLFIQQSPQFSASSLDGIMQSLATGQFILELFVLVYVVWYMNRGPARAFYRGYYLTDPAETISQQT